MNSPGPARLRGRHILVADEDPAVVAAVIHTLRSDGHAVFHAYDGQSTVELAYTLHGCDLVTSNTRVDGFPGLLREPFSAEEFRAKVGPLLEGSARREEPPA